MKLIDIISETPFTAAQETRFLSSLEKEDTWPTRQKMARLVKKSSPKARRVGWGHYSDAYGKPRSSMIIKITTGGDGDMTLKFLKWAKQRKNPHLPKIYTVKEMGSGWEVQAYARMEKLVPFYASKHNWTAKDVPFLQWMYQNEYSEEPERFVENWNDLRKEATRKKYASSKLLQTVKSLEKLSHGHLDIELYSGDLMSHNIMMRPSTGEIVIHDPF